MSGEHDRLTEGFDLQLDFTKLGQVQAKTGMNPDTLVVPVVVQDANTLEVLVLAYTNRQALLETMQTGDLVLWSTSRNELWKKGKKESGNTFKVLEAYVNCDQNSLLYLVESEKGGMCHTKRADGSARRSCFYRQLKLDASEGAKLVLVNSDP